MEEELFARLRTLQDVWDHVWSGHRGLVQLRAGGRVVETTERRPNRAGDLELQVVLCRR